MTAIDSEPPSILYKYRKLPDKYTEAIFTHGEIYFATVNELNDPFEHFFSYSDSGPYYRIFSPAEKSRYPHTEVTGNTSGVVQLDQETAMQHMLDHIKRDPQGIFSLCANNKSIPMYAHYAGGFKGVCIGFDWRHFNLNTVGSSNVFYQIPEYEFNDAIVLHGQIKWCFCEGGIHCKFINFSGCEDTKFIPIDNEIKNGVEEVRERRILKEIETSLHLNGIRELPPREETPRKVSYALSPPTINSTADWAKVFTTKTIDFKWEEEWRLFFYPGKWRKHNIRTAIKEIIFGHLVSRDEIEKVMHLVHDIKNIRFFITSPRIGQFKLALKEITLQSLQRDKELII